MIYRYFQKSFTISLVSVAEPLLAGWKTNFQPKQRMEPNQIPFDVGHLCSQELQ